MPFPRMSNDQEATAVQFFVNGMEPADIAETLGCKPSQVYYVLRKHDIRCNRSGRRSIIERLSPEDIEDIVDLYENTNTPSSEIALKYNMSLNQFIHLRIRIGLPTRSRSPMEVAGRVLRADGVIEDYRKGEPIWYLRQKYGVSTSTIYEILHKAHIGMRSNSNVRIRYEYGRYKIFD